MACNYIPTSKRFTNELFKHKTPLEIEKDKVETLIKVRNSLGVDTSWQLNVLNELVEKIKGSNTMFKVGDEVEIISRGIMGRNEFVGMKAFISDVNTDSKNNICLRIPGFFKYGVDTIQYCNSSNIKKIGGNTMRKSDIRDTDIVTLRDNQSIEWKNFFRAEDTDEYTLKDVNRSKHDIVKVVRPKQVTSHVGRTTIDRDDGSGTRGETRDQEFKDSQIGGIT